MNIRPYEINSSKELPSAPLGKLVLVTTNITKIHGKHLYKDGMAYNKTHVELRSISCTH